MSGPSTASRFGSCRGHSQQGMHAPADRLDGLCAVCRYEAAEAIRKQNSYNGSKPLAEDPVSAASMASNAKRINGREERKQAFRKALEAALKKMPWAKAVLAAGREVELADKTARDYGRELKAENPGYWAAAEAARQ